MLALKFQMRLRNLHIAFRCYRMGRITIQLEPADD